MTTTQTGREGYHPFASGLVVFASVMLIVFGILDFFRGLMAIARNEVFVSTPNYMFKFDLTAWGWLHLIFGLLAIAIGLGLMKPSRWARIGGVVLAGILVIVNFLSLPYYPLWSLVAIAMYCAVIWALCVVRTPDTP
ncbi:MULTISPECIES: DUF7144 family membrane protein [Streptomyces]|jgi:hypothetical protein|uniref:DUF7144 family membrane protein n=1 Tax=Streptomyces TaxID=1883 RepID=UPI000F7386CE|nr:hypothetical protein [Streptomyces sp. WAC05292]RSS96308.1 hypothetical protein EF903_02990 [Streptomyces sp. WAC05292]